MHLNYQFERTISKNNPLTDNLTITTRHFYQNFIFLSEFKEIEHGEHQLYIFSVRQWIRDERSLCITKC